jgi:hypothetical protein
MSENTLTGIFLIGLIFLVGCAGFRGKFKNFNVETVVKAEPARVANKIVTAIELADLADRRLAKRGGRAHLDIKDKSFAIAYSLNEKLKPLGDAKLTKEEIRGYLNQIDLQEEDMEVLNVFLGAIETNIETESVSVEGEPKIVLVNICEIVSLVKEGLK